MGVAKRVLLSFGKECPSLLKISRSSFIGPRLQWCLVAQVASSLRKVIGEEGALISTSKFSYSTDSSKSECRSEQEEDELSDRIRPSKLAPAWLSHGGEELALQESSTSTLSGAQLHGRIYF